MFGPAKVMVPIPAAAGKSQVRFRFHYTASFDGWWMVDGVNPGRAGEPQIQVTFEVDGQGRLSVSARQDARKLKVTKVDSTELKLKPAALLEPGDLDEAEEDPE